MKITQEEIKQMIEEEVLAFLDEEADPAQFDPNRFPMKLSDVDPAVAKVAVTHGHSDYDNDPTDDEISVNKSFESPVGDLKPSQ